MQGHRKEFLQEGGVLLNEVLQKVLIALISSLTLYIRSCFIYKGIFYVVYLGGNAPGIHVYVEYVIWSWKKQVR